MYLTKIGPWQVRAWQDPDSPAVVRNTKMVQNGTSDPKLHHHGADPGSQIHVIGGSYGIL